MGLLSGLATSAAGDFQGGMGVDAADYDNDGRLDVFVTNFAHDYSTLYRNRGGLMFEDVTQQAGLIQPEWLLVGWGTGFYDLDHDGWKDIFHSNGHVYPFILDAEWSETYFQPSSIYVNRRDGTFRDVRKMAGDDLQKQLLGRGMAFADIDNDGDMDFLIGNLNGVPRLYRHQGAAPNHWVMFRARGVRSNRDGIGARITVVTRRLRQVWEIKRTVGIYSASDPRAHFGLGKAGRIDRVEVKWPSGVCRNSRTWPPIGTTGRRSQGVGEGVPAWNPLRGCPAGLQPCKPARAPLRSKSDGRRRPPGSAGVPPACYSVACRSVSQRWGSRPPCRRERHGLGRSRVPAPTRERGRLARMHSRCLPLGFPGMRHPPTLPGGTA